MNGFSHPYHLDESTIIFRGIRSNFSFLFNFFYENHVSKRNGARWDAAFCGVTSSSGLYGLSYLFNSHNVAFNKGCSSLAVIGRSSNIRHGRG